MLEVSRITDIHAPLKKLGKSKAKLFASPWVTKGIRKSIKVGDKIHRKVSSCKNHLLKNTLCNKYKKYRNMITDLIRLSKTNHYKKVLKS